MLSVVAWYHYAFLTISLVMLGLGVPGVWFALTKNPDRFLPHCLAASCVAVPLTTVVIVRFGAILVVKSVIVLIVSVLPSTLALGSVVCLLLMRARGAALSRMYAIDLAGACVGALLVIPLLTWIPTPHLMASCGLAGAFGLVFYGGRSRWMGIGLAAMLAGVLAWPGLLQVTRSKAYDETGRGLVFEKWTPIARITIFDERFMVFNNGVGFMWGAGTQARPAPVRSFWLEQDGNAGTPITSFNGDPRTVSFLYDDVTTVGHQVRPPRRTAIIGGGGGRDILSALIAHCPDIDVIELNRHTIDAVSTTFGALSGDVYHQPGVHAIAGEGRSVLTRSSGNYDLIQISLIDSWAASAAGAFALAENNLYTVEAFKLYLDKLSEPGMLSTSRWLSEAPRLLILARAAMQARGVANPERHFILMGSEYLGTLLISKQPFAEADVDTARRVAKARGFSLIYPPGAAAATASASEDPARDALLADIARGRYDALRGARVRTEAPTDDSPYFFHSISPFSFPIVAAGTGMVTNIRAVVILQRTMVVVTALALGLFFLPFALGSIGRTQKDTSTFELVRPTLFFAAIGAGFMLLENTLLQRFVLYLSHPSYSVTVVIASLLAGMGLGSFISPRIGVRRLVRLGFLGPLLILATLLLLTPLFRATLGAPLEIRILLSCTVLSLLGTALGVFFPIGMMRFGDAHKPWYWAINGAFGVVASVLSLALSMEFGFMVVGALSVAVYMVAWLCVGGEPAAATIAPAAIEAGS